MKVFALLIAALLLAASAADAQRQLTLEIQDGLVTLSASNVPVRTIMAEWAAVGGTNVVNGDQLGSAPITLQLEGVPELAALDIILRDASGYISAPRRPGEAGASSVGRIVVLASSQAPPAPVRRPTPATQGPAITPRPELTPPSNVPQPPEFGANLLDQDAPPTPQPTTPERNAPSNPFFPGLDLPSGAPGVVSPVPESNPQ